MYMQDLWASLARRWYLVLACLLATAALAFYVSEQVEPTYESQAEVVLVPPKSVADPTENRYLSLSGLRQAVDVLTRSLAADSTISDVKKLAPNGKFEVISDVTTSAPILVLKVKANSPADAQRLLDAVLAQVPVNLRELQSSIDIPKISLITPQIVSNDKKPKAVHKKEIRIVAGVVAVALLLSGMLVGGVDSRLVRRERDRLAIAQEHLRGKGAPGPRPKRAGTSPKKPESERKQRDVVSAKVRR